jgi:hypothetical protein
MQLPCIRAIVNIFSGIVKYAWAGAKIWFVVKPAISCRPLWFGQCGASANKKLVMLFCYGIGVES